MNNNINKLLKQSEQYPDDDKLLAKLVFYYMENPDGDKDLKYLDKAYQVNPSIENTHNLAFWSMYEYGDAERSLTLQKQVIEQQPSSYYPYASYAQMLSFDVGFTDDSFAFKTVEQYTSVIKYCLIAFDKFHSAPIKHRNCHQLTPIGLYNNIACTYAMLDNYEKAFIYFIQGSQMLEEINSDDFDGITLQPALDEEKYIFLLNKTRLNVLMGNTEEAMKLLNEAQRNTQCDNLDIANLYARVGAYDLASKIAGEDHIHDSWEWIWYAIYYADQDKWQRMKQTMLEEEIVSLDESQSKAEKYRLEDKLDLLEQEYETIKHSKNVINNLITVLEADSHPKPIDSIKTEFHRMFFGCLLFGCPLHNSLIDDNNRHS